MSDGVRRRSGLQSRLAITIVLIVLATSGGTAVAVFLTLRNWLYDNAATTAEYIFRGEMNDLEDSSLEGPYPSALSSVVSPDVTVYVDDDRAVLGSINAIPMQLVHRVDASDGEVQSLIDGRRVLLGAKATVTTAYGDTVTITAYTDRTLPGIKSGMLTLGVVTGISIVLALAIAAASAWWLGGRVVTPLRQLNAAASRSSAGDFRAALPDARITEVAELAAGFNDMQRKHVESLERSKRFVSDVSHELRTPLAAMVPVAEVLDEEQDSMSPDAQRATAILAAEVRALSRLVEDLIDISRHDEQRASFHPRRLDLIEVVRTTLQTRGWADEVPLSAPETAVYVDVDPRRIDIAVANLVANGLQHGDPPIEVAISAAGDRVLIHVSDRGPGIPPSERHRVFDRFAKGDSARSRREGSGLGLSLAMANVALHRGTIGITSLHDPTTFTITLPARRPVISDGHR